MSPGIWHASSAAAATELSMVAQRPACTIHIEASTLAGAYEASGAGRWSVSLDRFREVLLRAVTGIEGGGASHVAAVLDRLHLADLALATACVDGHTDAWETFVGRFQPELRRAARAIAGPDAGEELADGLLGELYGVKSTQPGRRSLLDHFHGRSRLGTWLRAVLAQRHVDGLRAQRHHEPLESVESALVEQDTASADGSDRVDVERLVAVFQRALDAELAALDAGDRLRLTWYYGQRLTLAEIGQLLHEHEATVSRKLARTRRELRNALDWRLSRIEGLSEGELREGYRAVTTGNRVDLSRWLDEGEP